MGPHFRWEQADKQAKKKRVIISVGMGSFTERKNCNLYMPQRYIQSMQFPFITYGMALYRVAQKERNGILPVIKIYNDWYQWMGYLLLRKMIPRSAILVKWFLF